MMREEGVVVGLDGAYALISHERKKACGSCSGEESCGVLSGGLGKKGVEIRARNPLHAEIGERVVLEIGERYFLRASFLVYVVPILFLIAAGSLVRFLALSWPGADAESLGALAGLVAMALSFYGLHRYSAYLKDDSDQQPVISRILY